MELAQAIRETGWSTGDWLSLGQLVGTVVGLGLAAIPLWKTASAVRATRDLLSKRLLTNDLLILLPQLHALEDDLFERAKGNDADQLEKALVLYARHAGTIQGHLSTNETVKDEKLVALIRASRSAARAAKVEIAGGTSRPLFEIAKVTLDKVSKATDEATELIARLQNEVD
ncbi:hypothetical protein [Herbiconiux sp. A18JL235]|uniref:Uncharacterized protein n=1 Tax=Herbiconiux sp. A18JL235 TaxID=3152363 RepID=A0AB39BLG9_9MICO